MQRRFRRLFGAFLVIVCLLIARNKIDLSGFMAPGIKGLNNVLSIRTALDPFQGTLLRPLLTPRVPGTEGHALVRNHILKNLNNYGWKTSIHEFTADTPHGHIPMTNVLARKEGSSKSPKLTLAAHYDSKKTPHGFIGATDSAFPCALLLWLASITDSPTQEFDFIFFDGEESFEEWSDSDSLYGSRALAEYQELRGELPSTLVLLDLIGAEARFPLPSWFAETKDLHHQLEVLNPQLVGGRNLHHLAGQMLDDHIPFLHRGVKVLHLIPPAFPDEWHTLGDDAQILHWPTIEAWADMMKKWLF